MLEFLNRPYPFSFQPKRRIKQIVPVGICVFLFFVIYNPFGNNETENITISAYMVSCAGFAALLSTVLIPLSFPKYFNENKWTLKRNLVWVLWINVIFLIILFFASNMYVIVRYNSFHDFTVKKFLWYLYIQFIFGIPLGIIVNLVNQYYLLKKHHGIATSVNKTIETSLVEKSQINSGKSDDTSLAFNKQKNPSNIESNSLEFDIDKFNKVKFDVDKIICVEALGNYINILYYHEENRKITIRETISNIEQKIGTSKFIYKPHRSYLVNLQNIENVTGDSQGLKIHLKNSDKIIPVSRNKIKEFRALVAHTI